MASLQEDLPSPVGPKLSGNACEEQKFLVPRQVAKERAKWLTVESLPFAIGAASVLQIFFHIFSNNQLRKLLRFEPRRQIQIWRYITYMLVHDDWLHLTLNVVMQCIFSLFLERRQGRLRVGCLYLLSGITGVLGASCVHPDLVIGASAGVYALLISNIADIVLNLETIKYKLCRLFCIGVIVLFDVIFNVVHFYSKDEPIISWVAHLVGGLTGLLMGFVLFQSYDADIKRRLINLTLFWTGFTLYIILLISLVILTFQIKKCTPSNVIRIQYVYFC